MVRPPGPRRLRAPQLGQRQGRTARPVRRPAGDRHLQYLQRANAVQLALPRVGRASEDRCVRSRPLSARVPGNVARETLLRLEKLLVRRQMNVAVVALANKMARTIWALLTMSGRTKRTMRFARHRRFINH
jgi:hypothetical protein